MEYKELFSKDFIGRIILFPSLGSSWKLIEKLREKNDQCDPEILKDFPNKLSGAYGTFLCENVDNPNEQNIIRIIMQVPYAGSEIAIIAERSRQASDELTRNGQDMLDAYSTLAEKGCLSVARLLGIMKEKQEITDLVPGGPIICLLIEKSPGRQMGSWFWNETRAERDAIRAAFKTAWIECVDAGFRPFPALHRMFWHSQSKKLTLYNFTPATRSGPTDVWTDVEWISWGVAIAPCGYWWFEETEIHPNMDNWTL